MEISTKPEDPFAAIAAREQACSTTRTWICCRMCWTIAFRIPGTSFRFGVYGIIG